MNKPIKNLCLAVTLFITFASFLQAGERKRTESASELEFQSRTSNNSGVYGKYDGSMRIEESDKNSLSLLLNPVVDAQEELPLVVLPKTAISQKQMVVCVESRDPAFADKLQKNASPGVIIIAQEPISSFIPRPRIEPETRKPSCLEQIARFCCCCK